MLVHPRTRGEDLDPLNVWVKSSEDGVATDDSGVGLTDPAEALVTTPHGTRVSDTVPVVLS